MFWGLPSVQVDRSGGIERKGAGGQSFNTMGVSSRGCGKLSDGSTCSASAGERIDGYHSVRTPALNCYEMERPNL